jgi:chromosome segregation ATPase
VINEEKESLTEAILKLENVVDSLRTELSNREADLQDTEENLDQRFAELKRAESKLSVLTSVNSKLRDQLRDSESSVDSLSRSIEKNSLEVKKVKDRAENDRKKTQIDFDQKCIALLQAEQAVVLLTEENLALSQNIDMMQTSVQTNAETEKILRSELEAVKTELDNILQASSARERHLVRDLNFQKLDNAQMKADLEEQTQLVRGLQESLSTLRAHDDRRSVEILQQDSKLVIFARKVESLEQHLREACERDAHSDEALHASAENVAALTNQLDEANKDLDGLNIKLQNVESAYSSALKEVCELKREVENHTKNAEHFRTYLEEKECFVLQNDVELQDRDSVISSLKANLDQMKEDLERSNNSLELERLHGREIHERIASVKDQSASTIKTITAELIEANNKIETLSSLNNNLSSRMSSQACTIEKGKKCLAEKTIELTVTRQALEASQESVISMQRKLDGNESERDRYRELSIRLETDCISLQDQLRSSKDSVQSLFSDQQSLNVALNTAKLDRERKIKVLASHLSAEEAKSSSLANELVECKKKTSLFTRDAIALQNSLEERVKLLEYDLDLKRKRQDEIVAERQILSDEVDHCRENLRQSKAEISRLNGLLKNSQKSAQEASDTATRVMKFSKRETEQLRQRFLEEKASLLCSKDISEDQLEREREESKHLAQRLRVNEDALLALQTDYNGLTQEKKDIISQLHQSQDALADLQFDLQSKQDISSDSESLDSPAKYFSSCELKRSYLELQRQLCEKETHVSEANKYLERKTEHVNRLASDLSRMSTEIQSLIESNNLLEERLTQVKLLKEASDSYAETAASNAGDVAFKLRQAEIVVEQVSNENKSLSDELQAFSIKAKADHGEFLLQKGTLERDIECVRQKHVEAVHEKEDMFVTLLQTQKLVATLEADKKSLTDKYNAASSLHSSLHDKIDISRNEVKDLKDFIQREAESFKLQLSGSESARSSLEHEFTEARMEIESLNSKLKVYESNKIALEAMIKQYQSETLNAQSSREEFVKKLTEASRVVASQSDSVKDLQQKAVEADAYALILQKKLDDKENQLKDALSSSIAEKVTTKQVAGLQQMCSDLSLERKTMQEDVSVLRDESRQLRKQLGESNKANAALQSRLTSLKDSLEKCKCTLAEERKWKEVARKSCKDMEAEIDSKQIEIDHYKAKVQVLSASAARMKSHRLLDQENVNRNDFEFVVSPAKACEAGKSSGDNAIVNEGKLLRFIEDLLTQTEGVFSQISVQAKKLNTFSAKFSDGDSVKSLDLAGLERGRKLVNGFRENLDDLLLLIPHAVLQLEEKREQIHTWNQIRVEGAPRTPNSKPKRKTLGSPPVLDAFQKIKDLFTEEILSPHKIRTSHADRLDLDFLKKVIISLEDQIDVLLNDLEAANDALVAKDALFSELEKLIYCREIENTALNAQVFELEARLTSEVSWKEATERELASIREGLNDPAGTSSIPAAVRDIRVHADAQACKTAAARLLLHTIDERANTAKAVAFRQWACQTSALRAVAKQGQAAAALARQLEETREKLVILKRHLRKTRRGPQKLDRIAEQDSEA